MDAHMRLGRMACASPASQVLSNFPSVSITGQLHSNHEATIIIIIVL